MSEVDRRAVFRLLVFLSLHAAASSSRTQQIGEEVRFLRLGANAICGTAVEGHTLLCFDPATQVPIGFGATLQVTQTNLTVRSGSTQITVTAAGAISVNGAPSGLPGSLTVAGTLVGKIDGIWMVRRETLLSPLGAIQDVCVVGTSACGLRLVLASDEPSLAVIAGDKVIIDDNISLPIVMSALLSSTIHVVSRWNIFSAQEHAQLVVPIDVPVDGSSTLTLRGFSGQSTCGNAYYRQETRTVLPFGECIPVTTTLVDSLDLSSLNADPPILAVRFDACPPLATTILTFDTFSDSSCETSSLSNLQIELGTCLQSGRYLFECMSAL